VKIITHFIIAILITFLLQGCMGSYPVIHPDGYYSDQFRPTFLSNDTALISYTKPSDKAEKAKSYSRALRRAAEVTIERGYRYFKVIDQRDFIEINRGPIYMFSETKTIQVPMSGIKIKFLENKSSNVFDANKIISQYAPYSSYSSQVADHLASIVSSQ